MDPGAAVRGLKGRGCSDHNSLFGQCSVMSIYLGGSGNRNSCSGYLVPMLARKSSVLGGATDSSPVEVVTGTVGMNGNSSS